MRSFARSIVETIRQPLLLLDLESTVRAANGAFYRAFRLEAGETIGRRLFELAHGGWDVPDLRTAVAEAQAGRPVEAQELRLGPAEGHRVFLLNARQVCDDDGASALLLAIEEVSDRMRDEDAMLGLHRDLEDRVRERTLALETSNRELEAFCYSVSHDLRAPLRAIDGFSDVLLRTYADRIDDKGRHYLDRVRAGTQRMAELIDDLLQLSQVSRGEMRRERLDLSALARASAADLRRHDPARRVSFAIEPDLTGWGDPGLVKIVLDNLIANAWKFTALKPSATISIGRTVHASAPAYFVRDNGAGFDMRYADKLFGAFQRLHPQRRFPGHGIGLATVQRVIHRHGGQVWAESAVDEGAAFYFTLPAMEAA